ncbi:DNA-cytosine methyltransferase [Candidatus Nitrosoglobus terrae]|uniref:Cytosine-specific methyltransferase n=1 Tax=Candidatus Nitrosoglobus terrae TaxID=1630141 RepID=A0A1Q2SNI7_9GAMM|nr:DNA (cytosine-5-)-methyltransferase [Candidatus Nitrosoglobus terrae]BAW80681.1 DNA-cytosine methyltransferase [Candidatus Nitrosoglobus terrae]
MDIHNFKFIDLFSGIGGFHQALANQGGKCAMACDWNDKSRETYEVNYSLTPLGDIQQITAAQLPDYDVLCAGFPCQPFSIAGVSKKNSLGKKHGFEDKIQGNMFFEIIRIAQMKRSKIMFLENVKHLKSHDKGNTWKVIYNTLLENDYVVFFKVVDGSYYVPQKRQRVFMVCFDRKVFPNIKFDFPEYPAKRKLELQDVIEKHVDNKYTLSDKLWSYLQQHKENSAKKGNGFGYGLIDPKNDMWTRTMSARYYKDGSEILIYQGVNKNPRRLTPNEARKLFGYPDDFVIPVSDTQAYRQFGNSVIVPAIAHTAEQIIKTIKEYKLGGAKIVEDKGFVASKQLTLFGEGAVIC